MVRGDQKTKAELSRELDTLRRRVAQLEQAKEKLHKSEQRYRSLTDDILDSSKVGIFILDDSFKVVWLNQALERYFGLRRKDVIGKDKRQLILKQIKDIFEEPETFVEKVFATYDNNTYIENFKCHVLADGQRENRWLEHWSHPLRFGLFAGGRIEHYTDITERKEAEEALRKREELHELFFSQSLDGFFYMMFDEPIRWDDTVDKEEVLDYVFAHHRITKVNDAMLQQYGASREQFIGLTPNDLYAHDIAYGRNVWRDFLDSGRLHLETDERKRDGTPIWIDGDYICLYDSQGRITGHFGVQREITEEKRAREALQESEQKYRALVEQSLQGIIILQDFQIVFANATAAKIAGLTVEEVLALSAEDIKAFIPAEEQAAILQRYEECLADKPVEHNYEFRFVRKNGDGFWLNVFVSQIEYLGKSAIQVAFIEITERKRAEEAYRSLVDHSLQGLEIFQNGRVVFANQAMADITGYTVEEMLTSLPEQVQAFVHPDDRELVWSRHRDRLNGEELPERYEFRGIRKDGSICWLEIHASRIEFQGKPAIQAAYVDITERKKAEKALRESKERLRVALSAAQMGTWRWDPVTNQDMRDASLNLILGLEAVESTQPVEDFLHFVHPEDRDMANEEIQRAIRERRTYVAEFRIIRPDGTVRWLRDQGKPLCDENDRVLCLTGAVIDITERKKAENELKESEERFRAIFDNAADGIILADMESKKFHSGNKVMWQMLGCDPEEIKNLGVVDIHPEEDLPYVIEQFENLSRGEFTFSRDIPVKRKDGSVFYADINSVTITLRGKTYLMGIFRDVTERKRAEEAVRDSESKYRTLVENLPQKIFLKDENSVYVSCNDNLARDFKIRSEEIAGKTDYDFFSKKLAEKYRADDKRIIESGQTEAIEEKYIQEGKERIIHTVKTPVKDEQGNTIGVLGIFWDITELKRRAEELNIYREKMVRAERLASVGTLSASLAHELTQPLTVLNLSIENSLAELEKTSCPDTVVEDLKEGLSEVSSIASIVNRFRNFARRSSEIKVAEVDLKAVAERIVKLLEESAWRAKVTLQVEGMDKLPPIYSHEKDLERLFYSLVENAIQAADGKKSRQVIISSIVKDEHIELQLSDNCGGIAPENLDKIFEPFFTTKCSTERTGLGLCVVERIVSQLGGKVRVESKLGKGSTFFVTLPIKGDER